MTKDSLGHGRFRKNIRAFLAIEPPENILQEISRLQDKIETGNQRPIKLDKTAGAASDAKIFRRYFQRRY